MIKELIQKLEEFKYMEKEGYCLDCDTWFDGNEQYSHTHHNILNNFCESSDVEGAIKVLKHILKNDNN